MALRVSPPTRSRTPEVLFRPGRESSNRPGFFAALFAFLSCPGYKRAMHDETGADPNPEGLLHAIRAGQPEALGRLLELYRSYLTLLARVQIGRRLQGKVDPADLVQATLLEAHRDFAQLRGQTEEALVGWLRQVLARNLANVVRHYFGTRRRDPRLERELADDLDRSSHALGHSLAAPESSPSQQAMR